MADADFGIGLFGWPLSWPREKRGRPEHQRTLETSNKVLLLFSRGRTKKEAALALGISVRTFEKHYFRELEIRHAAALMFEAEQLHRLNEAAKEGNVAAEKELMKAMDRAKIEQLPRAMQPARGEKLGKKQQRHAAAIGAHKESSWGDLVGGGEDKQPPLMN